MNKEKKISKKIVQVLNTMLKTLLNFAVSQVIQLQPALLVREKKILKILRLQTL